MNPLLYVHHKNFWRSEKWSKIQFLKKFTIFAKIMLINLITIYIIYVNMLYKKKGQKGRPVAPANPKPVLNQLMRKTNVFDDRREMTDTIKKVVEDHPVEECPSCVKIRDED
jgi:hypothetical protein